MPDRPGGQALRLLQELIEKSKALGATDADAVLSDSLSVSVSRRLGKPESLQRAEDSEIGLRVFVGRRSAIVSSSDRAPEALAQMAARAVAMAKCAPEDLYAGIAAPEETAKAFPDLDLYDPADLSMEEMNARADRAEQAALEVKGITNSEGADFGYGKDTSCYAASNGFAGCYSSSAFSIGVAVIAGAGTAMEVSDDFDSATFLSDLRAPEAIGKKAAARAVSALNPRKVSTCRVPLVFDSRISGGLISSLAGAVSGAAVARGTTLLKDRMGQAVFNPAITIIDDPFIRRGHRSHPFDGEGVAPQKRAIIDQGKLTGWLLDLSSARQLGLKTTGNAARGAGSNPSPRPANFYMQPGKVSPEEMVRGIDTGFFVTDLLGSGVNLVTGDYSRGAKGFWIEKGEIAYPVSEVTIAGNLREMWMNCAPASDLEFRFGIDAPTLRVDGMTVAGS